MNRSTVTKSMLGIALFAAFLAWGGVAFAQLIVSVPAKTTVTPGEAFTVPLNLSNTAGASIDAFGLKVTYPTTLLEYDTVSAAGTLTQGWLVVNGNENTPGEVTIGGFNLTPITTSGVLINLKFIAKTTAAGKDSIKISELRDKLQNATPGNGEIEVFAAGTVFHAVLSGLNEVPPDTNIAGGGGLFVLNAAQTELTFNIRFRGLSGPMTAAHFHNAARGVNGPVRRTLTADFVGEVASGTWRSTDAEPLTPALVAELLAGNIYVNVHTALNPGGEIRGQLGSGALKFGARIDANQEVPPNASLAAGYGAFTLNATADSLTYNIGVTGLSGPITVAHFHNAPRGVNGGVVRNLHQDFVGSFANGVWTSTDAQALTPALVVELLASNLYVNIHTSLNPGGEVRGQVLPGARVITPIGLARQIADGTRNVSIEGIITTVDFNASSATSSEYYLQDRTGGLRLFSTGKPNLALGARVLVKNGLIGTNAQRKNIETASDSISTIDTPGVPPPQLVTATEYVNNRASLEGELLRINNASIISGTWPAANANSTVTINDGTMDLAMFLDRDTDIDGTPQPPNPFGVIGVATSFNNTPQIQPSARADFKTTTVFFATLSGAQENPPVTTNGAGGGMFVLNEDQTALSYNVSVLGLSGPITAAHFHNAATGSNGPVVRDLTFTNNVTSGTWSSTDANQPFTAALLAELLAGNLYVNVHTAANPGGEIRGQVLLGAAKNFTATLNGAQENPPVNTAANGNGGFTLNATGSELSYNVSVNGLSGPIAAAHFHNAAIGVNGPVMRDIFASFVGNTATGIWKASDAQALTPALVAELLAGKIYVNVHTAQNPGGEIRGQVLAGAETIFLAVLDGGQENPPVNTQAVGGGRFVLNADRTALTFKVKVANLSGPITASHFHNAATGTNGPVVRDIAFTDTVATGTWSSTDANQPLTNTLINELLAGNLYVNVHTAQNPGGEIRGQVRTGVAINFAATINGAQENPPVTTNAAGAGTFTLNANATELSYNVGYVNLSSPYTASHFHQAGRGKNGPVVRAIDFAGATTTSGIWKSTDAQALTSDLVVELLARQIYVNIHSSNFPGGEIRGQVLPGAQAILPIALARQTANTTVATVEGIVTRARGRSAQLQDASAAIVAFQTSGPFRTAIDSGAVRMGDLLRVTGTLTEFNGLKEFSPISSFEVLSRDNPLPVVQLVTLAELESNGEAYESELIRVENLRTDSTGVFVAARNYVVRDPSSSTGAVILRTPSASDTRIAGVPIPTGAAVFEGVLGQFSSTNPTAGYQLSPILPTDVSPFTGVEEQASELPAQFALLQNYPNPFNPTTNIRYALPEAVRVKLVIYNLLGERVRTLIDASESAGAKQITWNGLNDRGVRVASGVYVYRLEAGTFVATRKLVVMK